MLNQPASSLAAPVSDWHDGLATLRRMRPPLDYSGVHIARWRQLIEDADRFLEQWEGDAIELGWATLDLFGCSRVKPFARIDLAGLIPVLDGRPVVEMTDIGAMIAERGARHTRFIRRRASSEQVALWELAH